MRPDVEVSGMDEDALLAEAVCRGEPGATERFFETVYPVIEREVSRYTGLSGADMQDMAGAVALFLTEQARSICGRYRPAETRLYSYLRAIVRRRCGAWYQANQKHRLSELGAGGPERIAGEDSRGEDGIVAHLDDRRCLDAVDEWVQRLPADDRILFVARAIGLRSARDVARELGTTPGNVNTRYTRLRHKLRAHLRRRGLFAVMWVAIALSTISLVPARPGAFVDVGLGVSDRSRCSAQQQPRGRYDGNSYNGR